MLEALVAAIGQQYQVHDVPPILWLARLATTGGGREEIHEPDVNGVATTERLEARSSHWVRSYQRSATCANRGVAVSPEINGQNGHCPSLSRYRHKVGSKQSRWAA